jgi:acyl-CoA reductase-like NAD-dependent aldehyde dehydrogenase
MQKVMIAIKTGNPIIFAFHPSAQESSKRAAEVVLEAAMIPVLIAIITLKIVVDVGFVVGVTPQITPIGSATYVKYGIQ